MSTEPTARRLGDENERCLNCGAGLALDQRYCLNCGERRAEARVPFMEILGSERTTRTREERDLVAAPPAAVGTQLPTPVAIGIGVGVVILLLGFGTVLGSLLSGSAQQPVVVGQAGTGGPSAAAANELAANKTGPFKDDWPEGKEGYTVQIQALKKDGTNPEGVAKAKTDTEAKGAAKVGALDSDNYKSLDPGNYVIYSGVYESEKEADGQLEQVNKKFPDARVIKVSAKESADRADKGAKGGSGDALKAEGKDKVTDSELLAGKEKAVVSRDQLDNIEKAAGNSKQSAKLPKVIGIEGKPPPKDNKAPGAGSDATTIK
jgi:hypothetical protein